MRVPKLDLPYQDLGLLTLRLSVGGLMLLHGIHKLGHGVEGIASRFQSIGLPGGLALTAYLGEVLAPIGIVVGLGTRVAAGLVAFTMVVAIALAHAGDVFRLSERSGASAVEVPLLYLAGALAIAALGPGRFALDRPRIRSR